MSLFSFFTTGPCLRCKGEYGINSCNLTRPGGRAAAAATTASTAAPSLLPKASETSAVISTNGASQADLQADSMPVIIAHGYVHQRYVYCGQCQHRA